MSLRLALKRSIEQTHGPCEPEVTSDGAKIPKIDPVERRKLQHIELEVFLRQLHIQVSNNNMDGAIRTINSMAEIEVNVEMLQATTAGQILKQYSKHKHEAFGKHCKRARASWKQSVSEALKNIARSSPKPQPSEQVSNQNVGALCIHHVTDFCSGFAN
jgi:hypothetical protein